jgi:hypothetical protein
MSARDELIEIVTSSPESSGGDSVWATDLVAAHRAEVLAEGAQLLTSRACTPGQTETPHHCSGLREGARLLLEAAGGTPDPGFFQPGRTYTSGQWANTPGTITHTTRTMTVTHIETSPDGSKRVALGWEQIDGKPYLIGVEDMDGWALADGGGEGQ